MRTTLLIACATVALGSSATAASFSCDKAATKVEHTICDDKLLSAKDGEMGRWLHKAMQGTDIKHEQRDWLRHHDRDCGPIETMFLSIKLNGAFYE